MNTDIPITDEDVAVATYQIWESLTGEGLPAPDVTCADTGDEVVTCVRLDGTHGEAHVYVHVSAAADAARYLSRAITGEDASVADGLDAASELANQVAGVLKVLLPWTAYIDPPLPQADVPRGQDPVAGAACASFHIGDSPLRVSVFGRAAK